MRSGESVGCERGIPAWVAAQGSTRLDLARSAARSRPTAPQACAKRAGRAQSGQASEPGDPVSNSAKVIAEGCEGE